ncbi:MAG: hypothetical protein NTY48_06275 [Candidatus Diapherotrites archaeon]|nr:hypothetical protein [Candidatus Diapherotrites archaeon]
MGRPKAPAYPLKQTGPVKLDGAFTNPRIMHTAIRELSRGKNRENVLKKIFNKHFAGKKIGDAASRPITQEDINYTFSPKSGVARRMIRELEFLVSQRSDPSIIIKPSQREIAQRLVQLSKRFPRGIPKGSSTHPTRTGKWKRVQGAHSNMPALITALDLFREGKTWPQIAEQLQRVYFRNYTPDEVLHAFTSNYGPAGGINKTINNSRGAPGAVMKPDRDEIIKRIEYLVENMSREMGQRHAFLARTPKARKEASKRASRILQLLHQNAEYRNALLRGIKAAAGRRQETRIDATEQQFLDRNWGRGFEGGKSSFEGRKSKSGRASPATVPIENTTAATQLIEAEREQALSRVLGELDPRTTLLIKIRFGFFGDWPDDKIISETGLSISEFKRRTDEALKQLSTHPKLREFMEK